MTDTKSKNNGCCSAPQTHLSEKQAIDKLKHLNQWVILEDKGERKLAKHYKVSSFSQGVSFIGQIEMMTREFNHHPEIRLSYNQVAVFWKTYSVKGVTELDFASAEACDIIFSNRDIIA